MKAYQSKGEEDKKQVREDPVPYGLSAEEAEEARLLRIMNMTDMEKLHSFTQMLRRNALLKKAKITHKD